MTDPDTLRALARGLCKVDGPRFHLDQSIASVLGQDYSNPPPYTASLDAKLPGEDIVKVFAPGHGERGNQDRWMATSRTEPARGHVAFAHTEPLARRAAALLAMAEKEQNG